MNGEKQTTCSFFFSRDDGRDSTTFYTDPQFFFNLWMQSMIQFPAAQHQYRGGKNERHRSPVMKINSLAYP